MHKQITNMLLCSKMKSLLLFSLLSLSAGTSIAGNKIKYYFNQPVDNSVSTGVNATYLNNCVADTLAAYLNRAKYSLDICVYDFDSTITFGSTVRDSVFAPEIARAINNAYSRGVKVRWIYEASNSNTGLGLLNPNIPTLGSPQGSNYTIMHNKFVVIDANSSDPNDAIVWTGCLNWYLQQFNWDYNNVVIFQDSALAHAYTGEFNQMWGDTGIAPNLSVSKFGMYKTDLGRHMFNIGGNTVELYFSPSDGTDSHIQSTIATANTDLYFGMYTFTSNTDAGLIMSKYNNGVYVAGLDDSWSNSYGPHSTFVSGLGANFEVYTETSTSIYHNKFLIVDPSDICSDPMVLTGSHNWSTSANTHNDENTVIIHNDTAANLYYQYFKASFNSLGGVLTPQHACIYAGVATVTAKGVNVTVFPNPSDGNFTISYQLDSRQVMQMEVFSVTGQKIATPLAGRQQEPGTYDVNCTIQIPGMYWIRVTSGSEVFCKPIVVTR